MAIIYKGKQSILDGALGEYIALGFALEENDDHVLLLTFKGETLIGKYNQLTVTVAELRSACRNFLFRLTSGLEDW